MRTRITTITPEVAKGFLANQIASNRPLNKRHVTNLARQIELGLWRMNGEAFKFDGGGRMIDGQHRCSAIVQANKPVDVLIVEGLPAETFQTLDNGRTRTATDFMGDVPQRCLVAATARWVYAYRIGDFPRKSITPSNSELLAIANECAGIHRSITGTSASARLGKGSYQTFLHYYYTTMSAYRRPIEQVDGFFYSLGTGANLDPLSPVYQLRERIMREKGRRIESREDVVHALYIKAMKHYMAGRIVKLTFQPGKEDFPALD